MSVEAIWRYPVKSMLGERIDSTRVESRGLLGDRAYALVDAVTGKIASAKNPRKWGRLFECSAHFVTEPVAGATPPPAEIILPGGSLVRSDARDVRVVLSHVLERDVELRAAPPATPQIEEYWPDVDGLAHRATTTETGIAVLAPGTFFDAAPVHIVTTATLARLGQLYEGRFDAARFRPNLVIDCGDQHGFPENDWLGKTLAIGELRLRTIIAAPRCVMTTLPQGDLPADVGILRTVAEHNRVEVPTLGQRPCVGVYAVVTQPGDIRRGDRVEVEREER